MPGSGPTPPGPPAPPSKDAAAKNVMEQGKKKPMMSFSTTDTGNNTPGSSQAKTLLGS